MHMYMYLCICMLVVLTCSLVHLLKLRFAAYSPWSLSVKGFNGVVALKLEPS